MFRFELFQTNGKCTIIAFLCLLEVTKFDMHSTQIIVTFCHIDVLRSELFQTNGQSTIMIFFCLLQVTKILVHSTYETICVHNFFVTKHIVKLS